MGTIIGNKSYVYVLIKLQFQDNSTSLTDSQLSLNYQIKELSQLLGGKEANCAFIVLFKMIYTRFLIILQRKLLKLLKKLV